MGAIGGIVDFKNSNIDFTAFNAIQTSQALRGRGNSTAYLNCGIGMFYSADAFSSVDQPIFSERRGYKSALIIDSPFFDGRLAMEAYRAYGVEFVGMLQLPFAMALYDSERRMLLLARDKKGKKPLYYSVRSGKVIFASEPKGILATQKDAIRVNADILSAHLTSPIGIYGASDIYADIYEVRQGECILFTALGISKFFYRESQHKKITVKLPQKFDEIQPLMSCDIDSAEVFSALDDALIAFDMPQFDSFMPSLCRLYLNADNAKKNSFQFKDPIKRRSIFYSYEREDRFNAFYGKQGIGVISKINEVEHHGIKEENEQILKFLTEAFFSIDRNGTLFLREIFGDTKWNCLLGIFDRSKIKKEDTELYIRILGMIYQTVEWSKLRDIKLLQKESFCI